MMCRIDSNSESTTMRQADLFVDISKIAYSDCDFWDCHGLNGRHRREETPSHAKGDGDGAKYFTCWASESGGKEVEN